MDEHIYHDSENEIREMATTINCIVATEKYLKCKPSFKYFDDLHIICNANIIVQKGHDFAHQLKN